ADNIDLGYELHGEVGLAAVPLYVGGESHLPKRRTLHFCTVYQVSEVVGFAGESCEKVCRNIRSVHSATPAKLYGESLSELQIDAGREKHLHSPLPAGAGGDNGCM